MAEQRLIDANAIEYRVGIDENDKQVFFVYSSDIKALPTVDPVKHGHWISDADWDCRCSACDSDLYVFDSREDMEEWMSEAIYCPKCGAKMD